MGMDDAFNRPNADGSHSTPPVMMKRPVVAHSNQHKYANPYGFAPLRAMRKKPTAPAHKATVEQFSPRSDEQKQRCVKDGNWGTFIERLDYLDRKEGDYLDTFVRLPLRSNEVFQGWHGIVQDIGENIHILKGTSSTIDIGHLHEDGTLSRSDF